MHHLHDGPWSHSSPSQPAPHRRPRASLAALQWAAERASLSYGRFTLNLRPEDEARIQGEFEAFKAGERREKTRVDNQQFEGEQS